MESSPLKKIAFMTPSQYSSATKSRDTLYMVEFQPNLSMSPNYSSGVLISPNTTYTVGSGALSNYSAGWYRAGLTSFAVHGWDYTSRVYINGRGFKINYSCAFFMVYLTSGDTFSTSYTWSIMSSYFFPVKA